MAKIFVPVKNTMSRHLMLLLLLLLHICMFTFVLRLEIVHHIL